MSNKFDIKTIYHKERPLSWSAISSFEWNPRQWYAKYVAKELPETTPELEFGSKIDKQLQDDPKFLPEIVRYPILQHELRCSFNGIPLVGYADTYKPPYKVREGAGKKKVEQYPALANIMNGRAALRDYKTGRKAWDQKRADDTGQLTMYCLMLWQMEKIRPEDVDLYIDWMPTHYKDKEICFVEPMHVYTFKTKRTMRQVLAFGQRILDTYKEMERFAEKESRLHSDSYADW